MNRRYNLINHIDPATFFGAALNGFAENQLTASILKGGEGTGFAEIVGGNIAIKSLE